MNLRCKCGDIAIITWDYPDCLENLGRMVEVRSPVDIRDGLAYWRIRPITPDLYAMREWDDTMVRESADWDTGVEHPDSWMIPIRPDGESTSIEAIEGLGQEAPVSPAASCGAEPLGTLP